MRLFDAFGYFFRVLFGGKLPASATKYLPAGAPALAAAKDEIPAEPKADDVEEAAAKAAPEPEAKPATPGKFGDTEGHREGALAMLGLLQREGRLVDFLLESIDGYDDSDVGAAVRDIHRGCRKVIEEHLSIEAVMPGAEDDDVKVPRGFDPGEVRLIGDVAGDPPFAGVLRHHGWRVTEVKFPALSSGVDRRVLAPAEVEVS